MTWIHFSSADSRSRYGLELIKWILSTVYLKRNIFSLISHYPVFREDSFLQNTLHHNQLKVDSSKQ